MKYRIQLTRLRDLHEVSMKYHRATEHRLSNLAGVNPAWKGESHVTNRESWTGSGNNAV